MWSFGTPLLRSVVRFVAGFGRKAPFRAANGRLSSFRTRRSRRRRWTVDACLMSSYSRQSPLQRVEQRLSVFQTSLQGNTRLVGWFIIIIIWFVWKWHGQKRVNARQVNETKLPSEETLELGRRPWPSAEHFCCSFYRQSSRSKPKWPDTENKHLGFFLKLSKARTSRIQHKYLSIENNSQAALRPHDQTRLQTLIVHLFVV